MAIALRGIVNLCSNNAMGLVESKGNMYSWVTHTWNPIKGKCSHDCTYCYMHRWGAQTPLRLVDSELKTNLGHNNFIFIGSSCDMFANNVPAEWIDMVLKHCDKFKSTYLFQSKNPHRFSRFSYFPARSLFCATIETNRFYSDIMINCPLPHERAFAMEGISQYAKYVTIEPIMDFDLDEMVKLIRKCSPSQVNIGADSGNNKLPEPPKEKILELISALKKFTVIDKKKNLDRLLK